MNFLKPQSPGPLSGFSSGSGVLGKLEAADYENVDMVSPIFVKITDMLCSQSKAAPVAQVVTLYVFIC